MRGSHLGQHVFTCSNEPKLSNSMCEAYVFYLEENCTVKLRWCAVNTFRRLFITCPFPDIWPKYGPKIISPLNWPYRKVLSLRADTESHVRRTYRAGNSLHYRTRSPWTKSHTRVRGTSHDRSQNTSKVLTQWMRSPCDFIGAPCKRDASQPR